MNSLLSALSEYIRLPERGRCKSQRRRRPAFRPRLEVLEDRLAPTVGPLGNEFMVNETANVLAEGQRGQVVAVDSSGQFVEVWVFQGFEGNFGGEFINARVFNADGNALTGEILVATGVLVNPSVAIDAQGDFVVTWVDSSDENIFAQRFNAAGTAQGDALQVNQGALPQYVPPSPGVAMDAQGDFVVSWSSNYVYARLYNAAGTPLGDTFQVSQAAGGTAYWSVAMNAQGEFAVCWDSSDAGGLSVDARQYTAAGMAVGNAFQVSPAGAPNQQDSDVDIDADGDIVVCWDGGAFGSSLSVYARRYNAAGTALGNAFQVNESPTGITGNTYQIHARVAMDPQGDFVVTWANLGEDGDGLGIFARYYDAAGTAQSDEFQVNQFTAGDQYYPSAAMDGQGGFVVTWQSAGQSNNMYARQFVVTGRTITFSPSALSAASLNQSYSQTITGMGGLAPYNNFTVGGGALPTGLSLSTTGVLSGIPTVLGTFTFTVSATDSSTGANAPYTGSQVYTLDVTDKFSYDAASKTLTISADAANNTFTFSQASTQDSSGVVHSMYNFNLNGVAQFYTDAQVVSVFVNGAVASANTAVLITNDTYIGNDGAMHETAETISLGSLANAGVGTMQKYDANGNPYTFLTLSGFPISYAYVGRNDGTVQLYGTAGVAYNGFVSAGNYSYIGGPGLYHEAQGAPSVYGYSAGQATDFAYHYAANAGSAFVVSGTAYSYMSCTDQNADAGDATQTFFNVAVGFDLNTGVSNNPGKDVAYIIDSPGNDTFVGGDAYSYMYSTGANGSYTEFDTAYAFALIYGQSFVGGIDMAINNDPNKNILVGFHLE